MNFSRQKKKLQGEGSEPEGDFSARKKADDTIFHLYMHYWIKKIIIFTERGGAYIQYTWPIFTTNQSKGKKTDDTIFPSMFNRCGSYLCLDIDLN